MEESAPSPIKVTALILSYNSGPALRQCLTALEASKGREQLEILVVDCGSVDGSNKVDTEFAGVTVLRLERNFGATKALNIGLRTAAADFALLLAPQVLVQPETVMDLAAALEANENAAAVCPLLIDETGKLNTEVRKLPSLQAMSLLWRDPDQLPQQTIDPSGGPVPVEYPGRIAIMVRKQFVRAINWFDERYGEFGGDLELAYQIRRSRKQILVIPSARANLAQAAPSELDDAALATLSADRAQGTSVFLNKHVGWFPSFTFKTGAVFYALGQLLSFQRPGFQFRQISALLAGKKIDGSQSTL